MIRQTEIRSVREAKKAEVLVSVIDRYLVLLTDTVTVLIKGRAGDGDANSQVRITQNNSE